MKKYIIAESGEPVNIGSIINGTKTIKTSFGTIRTEQTIEVTEYNIDSLIQKGIIKEVQKTKESYTNDIGYYISKLAKLYHKSFEEVTDWLDTINKTCPKAVLDILLQAISIDFYNKDIEAYEAATGYYSIKLKDGSVGEVIGNPKYIPKFKSIEDVEAAREILKDQLELMYGKK